MRGNKMPAKTTKKISRKKMPEELRKKRLEYKLREKIGPQTSEAFAFSENMSAIIERLEPFIERGPQGEISFYKKPAAKQLQIAENVAKALLEKYRVLNEGYKTYKARAKRAGLDPAGFAEPLTPFPTGFTQGQKIMLMAVEAQRILKAVEQIKKK